MSDLIPWYLVELRSRLSPFLDPKLVETIVGETKSHLSESVKRLEAEQQLSEDQATSAAVGSYGNPEKVAFAHLKEHAWRPLGVKPIYLVIGGALASTTCWTLHWQWLRGYFDNRGATWENGLALVICALATAMFAVGCYAGRRRYRAVTLSACLGMMVGLPFLYSFLVVGSNIQEQGLNRLFLTRDSHKVEQTLQRLDRLDAYVINGERIFAGSKSPADIPMEYSDAVAATWAIGGFRTRKEAIAARFNEISIYPSYATNGLPDSREYNSVRHFDVPWEDGGAFAYVDGQLDTGLAEETNYSRAIRFWRQRSPLLRKRIGQVRTWMSSLLSAATEARNGRIFFFDPAKYSQQIQGSIPSFLIILLIVEAGTFSLLRRRRWRPELVRA